jgi:hypothetical protein
LVILSANWLAADVCPQLRDRACGTLGQRVDDLVVGTHIAAELALDLESTCGLID